jgi:hypothetical protein
MAQQKLVARFITLGGVGAIAALLFWMALYILGPLVLVVNVVALAIGIAWLARHAEDGWVLAERVFIAGLVAGQAGLIVAVLVRIAPVVAKHAL